MVDFVGTNKTSFSSLCDDGDSLLIFLDAFSGCKYEFITMIGGLFPTVPSNMKRRYEIVNKPRVSTSSHKLIHYLSFLTSGNELD